MTQMTDFNFMKTAIQHNAPQVGQSDLVVREPQTVATVPPQGITIEAAFHAVMNTDLNAEKLAVMKQLLAMNAEQQFNAAFVKMQAEMPIIVATSIIPNRGKYERFEDILRKVSPIMAKHGFSVAFSQNVNENRIVETCKLMHAGGHSQSNSFAVRAGGKADSDTQADCKASTTAKRNAFCNAINIVIAQDIFANEDNDASLVGDPNAFVTPQQAEELERRCHETESNIPAFLKFAGGAKDFFSIPANKYDMLDASLRRKEQQGR